MVLILLKQNREDIQVVLLNQSVGPLFMELAVDLSKRAGKVLLVTGSKIKSDHEELIIKIGPSYDRKTILSRVWSWALFLLFTFREVLSINRTIPILVVSNPPLLPLVALVFRLLRHQQYVILVYDIYPDIPKQLGLLSSRFIIAMWGIINKSVFMYAKYVVTLGPYMAHTLEKYFSSQSAKERIVIIPTWVDTDIFIPRRKIDNSFARDNGQIDKLTMLYSGNIGFTHDIRLLIDAAVQLRDDRRISFLIIGEGHGKTALMEKVKCNGLNNVIFLPYQPEEFLPYSLACADVSIISIADGIEGLMMPSKTYYAMAVGSAIIGLSRPPNDLAKVIEESGCGMNIEPGDLKGLIHAISMFADYKYLLDKYKFAARQAAIKTYSRSVNSKLFVNLLKTCFSNEFLRAKQ